MKFRNKEEALAWVEAIVFVGSYPLGRLWYVVCWAFAQVLVRVMGKKTKVVGISNLWVRGPAIFVSNHVSNWDFFRLVICTPRHLRPLYKVKAFRRPVLRGMIALSGALPISQPPKKGEELTRAEKQSAMYLTRATHSVFSRLIRRKKVGVIYAQGQRRDERAPVGTLNPGIFPLFQHQGMDPLIVIIGHTSKLMVVHEGVRLSEMPSKKDEFLGDLQQRMQSALDEASDST